MISTVRYTLYKEDIVHITPHLIASHIVVDLVHCPHHGAHCSHQLVEGISFWQLQVAQIHSYGVALTQSDCPLLISHPIV